MYTQRYSAFSFFSLLLLLLENQLGERERIQSRNSRSIFDNLAPAMFIDAHGASRDATALESNLCDGQLMFAVSLLVAARAGSTADA